MVEEGQNIMLKKLFFGLLLLVSSFGLSGCFSLVDWEHNLNHIKVWNSDLDNMHRSIDRYFFNYDWDDPNQDLNFETPNT